MDIASYCVENPNATISDITNNSSFPNCNSTISTPGGNVNLYKTGNLKCTDQGVVTDGGVIGNLTTVNDYQAKCVFDENGSMKCTVEGK
jgi:hypothetical protein